jgi:hypothetical protein
MAADPAVALPITAGAAATRVDARAAARPSKEDLGVKCLVVQRLLDWSLRFTVSAGDLYTVFY